MISAEYDFQNQTAAQILSVLEANHSPDGWSSAGLVDPPALLSLSIGWETFASAFQKVIDACQGEVDFDEANKYIYIYEKGGLGSAVKYIHIKPDRNQRSVSLQRYSRDLINKVYGVGGDTPRCTIAGARHIVYSVVGQVVTVDHNKLVPENDSWNTYKIRFATGALAGSSFVISDCAHGTARDTLTLTGSLVGAAAGDKIVITDSLNNDVDHIRAGASISSYGIVEAAYINADKRDIINLVEYPFLDGAYSSGVCAGWIKNGAPTYSENTNRYYIQNGSKSQKVIGGADADGIYQNISGLTIGEYYRIKVNLYLDGSTPVSKINVYLGTAPAVPLYTDDIESEATGRWVSFDWWGQAGATTTRITILQSGAQSATFYVDAVQIALCPVDSAQNFTSNCEQLDLWKEVFDYLIERKDPLVEYKCNFIDLNRMNPVAFLDEKINLGDTVLITDTDLGLSEASARVREIGVDVFRPELTEHTVSNI
jgi:hypothetical protein